jgi:hypothetical protein
MIMKKYLIMLLGLLARDMFLKIQYFRAKGRWPDIKKPRALTEIIFKLKLYSDNSLSNYCDKIQVRDYIKNIIEIESLDLLLPVIAFETHCLKKDQIPSVHPDGFLKLNNGSGYTLFVKANSLSKFSQKKIKKINSWRNNHYHLTSGENCYAKITEKIYFEEALRTKDNYLPDDIKVHCFNGDPYIYQIIRRTSGILERQSFDKEWEKQIIFQNEVLNINFSQNLKEKITKASKALSRKFSYVRVDFYLVDEDIYFGELTFFPASSHLPLASREVDLYYGNKFLQTSIDQEKLKTFNIN